MDRRTRCQILLLHRTPYTSLPAETIPGQPRPGHWLDLSQTWSLNHELAHIACKRLVGEIQINLYDELVADALGMSASLGIFDADLFRRGLGLSPEGHPSSDARAHVYVSTLEETKHHTVFQMVLQRAVELDRLLQQNQRSLEPMPLLAKLVNGRLDQPFSDGVCCKNDSSQP